MTERTGKLSCGLLLIGCLALAYRLMILTDWDEFATPPGGGFRTMRHPVVIDCVGVMDARREELRGVEYVAMGQAGRR